MVKTVIMLVIASVQPSMWIEAKDAMRRDLRSVEAIACPAAERSAEWFETQKHALRDWLRGIEVGAGKAAEAKKEKPVLILHNLGAITGPVRVIGGDTLDLGGVRIRLHGIDVPTKLIYLALRIITAKPKQPPREWHIAKA